MDYFVSLINFCQMACGKVTKDSHSKCQSAQMWGFSSEMQLRIIAWKGLYCTVYIVYNGMLRSWLKSLVFTN